MTRGINKVTLIGNLGNEPEIRRTASGSVVATISVATGESWTDKTTGEKKEKTEWHRIVFFGAIAEIVETHLHKGSQIYVEGRLQTNKWIDKEGVERYSTQVIARDINILNNREPINTQSAYQSPPESKQPAPDRYNAPPLQLNEGDVPF